MNFIKSTIQEAMAIPSVKRLLLASAVAVTLGTIAFNFNLSNQSADALVKKRCVSSSSGTHNVTGNDFKPASIALSGSTATATFKFPGYCKDQSIPVTLVSYMSPNTADNKPFSQQRVSSAVSAEFNVPRDDAHLSVNLPSCRFQVDLVLGAKEDVIQQFSDADGSPGTYSGQGRMITAGGGNLGIPCPGIGPAPAPAPAPAAPAPAPVVNNTDNSINNSGNSTITTGPTTVNGNGNNVCSTNTAAAGAATAGSTVTNNAGGNSTTCNNSSTNTVTPPPAAPPAQPASVVTTVASAPEVSSKESPSSLPNTGPGALAGLGFGSTFMSTLAYAYRGRFPDMLARLIARF